MPSGGKRVGAGRKKKALADKILEGNPGRRKLKVLEFEGVPEEEIKVPDWLNEKAKEIFDSVVSWLKKIDCLQNVFPYHIEEYALCKSRWFECEAMNSKHGLLAKKASTGQPIQSPYVDMAILYLKQTDTAWSKIYEVVKERCIKDYEGTPNDDVMERLLTMKRK